MNDEDVTEAGWTRKMVQQEWMIELDIAEVSRAIWGFLNICLSGAARDVFEDAGIMGGLNAWRLLVYEFRSSA